MKQSTFDISPQWVGSMRIFAALLTAGDSEGKRYAEKELRRVGVFLDNLNETRKDKVIVTLEIGEAFALVESSRPEESNSDEFGGDRERACEKARAAIDKWIAVNNNNNEGAAK